MSASLTSWTRTLNAEDALLLFEHTEPGEALDAWTARAHSVLPQAGRARRTETIRLVRDGLLDHHGGVVIDSAFLRLLREASPGLRADLLHGRRLLNHPWIEAALGEVVYPQLALADEPLAPRGADIIPPAAWTDLLDRHMKPGTGAHAIRKTRNQVQRNLARLGVIRLEGNTARESFVRRGEPDPAAFSWLVAFEMARADMAEAPWSWALSSSRAARIFAPAPIYAERCLERGLRLGLLRRGYLAGAARLHVGRL